MEGLHRDSHISLHQWIKFQVAANLYYLVGMYLTHWFYTFYIVYIQHGWREPKLAGMYVPYLLPSITPDSMWKFTNMNSSITGREISDVFLFAHLSA